MSDGFSEQFTVVDKCPVFIDVMGRQRRIRFGRKVQKSDKIYTNPIREAMRYKRIIDTGLANSQADLSRILGVSRAQVTHILSLLELDEDIKTFILSLKANDKRLQKITCRQLRAIVKLPVEEQKMQFERLLP